MPPKTEFGIKDFCNAGISLFKIAANSKLASKTETTKTKDQTLNSEKTISVLLDIFVMIIQIDVF